MTSARGVGAVRWVVCLLLFLAATINYIDRQVLSILKPTLQAEFGWTEVDYADIVFAFQLAYAIGFIFAGRLMDRVGTKIGFALAIAVWSVAAALHAEAPAIGLVGVWLLGWFGQTYSVSVAGFILARFLLGLGESGNFPASIKTVAEWFPRGERAFATGIFNSGTNIGALVAPIIVPWITYTYGWYWAFVVTGLVGFVWMAGWLAFYHAPERHPRVTPTELAYIRSEPVEPVTPVPWSRLIRHRQTWAFALGKFLTDPIWWLYLFWIPDFLSRTYGLDLKNIGPPLVAIYLAADVGSIGGGWLSSWFLRRGFTPNAARKLAMLAMAVSVLPVVGVAGVQHLWVAVAIIGLAAAAHQGWSANLFTLTSDLFPKHAIGSVVGFGGMMGAIGGMLISKVVGYLLDATGSYMLIFAIAGTGYLVALAVIHGLAPRMARVHLE